MHSHETMNTRERHSHWKCFRLQVARYADRGVVHASFSQNVTFKTLKRENKRRRKYRFRWRTGCGTFTWTEVCYWRTDLKGASNEKPWLCWIMTTSLGQEKAATLWYSARKGKSPDHSCDWHSRQGARSMQKQSIILPFNQIQRKGTCNHLMAPWHCSAPTLMLLMWLSTHNVAICHVGLPNKGLNDVKRA